MENKVSKFSDQIQDDSSELITHIDMCKLPKIPYNNTDKPANAMCDGLCCLKEHFPVIIKKLTDHDYRKHDKFQTTILPNLILLYLERSSNNSWNNQMCKDFAYRLSVAFQNKCGVPLDQALNGNAVHLKWNVQLVFDNVIQELNRKVVSDDLRMYPAVIDAYCNIVRDLKNYDVHIIPIKIFPICLYLIDELEYKVKGLRCCAALLECMNETHFQGGNYYEVLFGSLKKVTGSKNIEVTKMVQECLLKFIKILPEEVKKVKTDEAFSIILEQLHMESNLYRKTVCFNFVKNILLIQQVNCINKRLMKEILYDNIHICCNDAVADILLVDVLECLQVWIIYCWCAWKLSSDHRLLSALIKLLYVSRKEKIATEIQNLIVSLVSLCSEDEKKCIHDNLKKSIIKTPEFKDKLDQIIEDIHS